MFPKYRVFKLDLPSHENEIEPEHLRGCNNDSNNDRLNDETSGHNVHCSDDVEIVHLGKKSQNECAVITKIGNREQRTLWDSGAGRCVISYECYKSLHPKYKTELFPSTIRIKAANSTFIQNKGECDITFELGGVEFTFPFLLKKAKFAFCC